MATKSSMFDKHDAALLQHLQTRGRATHGELAQVANLSESACFRRVRALEAAGVITGYAATLDPRLIGLGLTVFVSIALTSQAKDVLGAFEAAVEAAPEIMECYLMAGQDDYTLRALVRDVDDLERLHANVLTRLPGVARINSSIALRTVVARNVLPVK